MSPTSIDDLITIDRIREIVNQWSQQNFLRIPNMGTRMVILERINYHCHTVNLISELERRSISQETVPYHGGQVDDRGTPPGIWDLSVTQPREFENRAERIPLPHTERVNRCRECRGDGEVRCSSCHGRGEVNCMWCHGTGYRERKETRTNSDGSTRWETVRENCSSCVGGRTRCTWCHGSGRQRCDTCDGSGEVKAFQQLNVQFEKVEAQEVIEAQGLPGSVVTREKGDRLRDLRRESIQEFEPVTSEADQRIKELLQRSQQLPDHSRLLFQRLMVDRILVHKIEYAYRDETRRELWIYGPENKVYAPGAPWRWWLLLGIILGILALVGGVIALWVWLM